jgi:uncharacterized protein (DUF433 family)
MERLLDFTAAEAAFVLCEPIKTIKKALDAGPVQPRLVAKPGGPVRIVDRTDLLYLFAVKTLRDELTRKARNEFYHALKSAPVEGLGEVRFGRLSVAVHDLEAEVEERARQLAGLADKVEFRKDGEPVLKGTDLEVHRIAALLEGGLTGEQICEDYPSLNPELIAVAKAYAEAYPKAGRPYPRTTVKRAIRGAGLEALDEVLDEEA